MHASTMITIGDGRLRMKWNSYTRNLPTIGAFVECKYRFCAIRSAHCDFINSHTILILTIPLTNSNGCALTVIVLQIKRKGIKVMDFVRWFSSKVICMGKEAT